MKVAGRFGDDLAPLMIQQHYRNGRWGESEIVPAEALSMAPQMRGLHYGQAVFEGQKAHRSSRGEVRLFRCRDHLERLNFSARRLAIPEIDVDALMRKVETLVSEVVELCPEAPGSLYVRPIIFADELGLLAEPADSYTLLVLISPVGAYLNRDRLVRVRTELDAARAHPGGTGDVKYSGNYAAVFVPKMKARSEGFDEILWLGGEGRRFVEETSSMNVMIVKDGALTTPVAGGTILKGITRDSLMKLALGLGIEVREEATSIEDDWSGVSEIFTSGTAVGVLPIGEVVHRGESIFRSSTVGPICRQLAAAYSSAVTGDGAGEQNWLSHDLRDKKGQS
ncbi:MAG: aminotransferase class IV [Planctomycetota bacterium]